jgi:DNA-binding protein YbaB
MTSPYDAQIEELLGEYRRQREEAVQTRQRVNEITGTATAKRQTVKVTASAQGAVTSIEFPTSVYKSLPPKELADVLMATIAQARADAMERMGDLMDGHLPEGVTMAALIKGEVDPSALLPESPGMPHDVQEYIDHGRPGSGGSAR